MLLIALISKRGSNIAVVNTGECDPVKNICHVLKNWVLPTGFLSKLMGQRLT